ncbi:Hypothetical_protein [Hexamita inflata]|uniref:Hypothetical_protein n=1 Tax=Hexamita inflata TaxID=28002 RepID=A0ABP1IJW3_9EUKA
MQIAQNQTIDAQWSILTIKLYIQFFSDTLLIRSYRYPSRSSRSNLIQIFVNCQLKSELKAFNSIQCTKIKMIIIWSKCSIYINQYSVNTGVREPIFAFESLNEVCLCRLEEVK